MSSSRMTKELLEFKCERIRYQTGLNVGIRYENNTQRVVLNGVREKGCSGSKNLSWYGSKKELGNVLDTVYNVLLELEYARDEYRLDNIYD